MDKKSTALACLQAGFNCAQSSFSAFTENIGIPRETALKVAACFGGGMKCGEVCGAVTGILMALGMKYGDTTENNLAAKQLAYAKGLEFTKKFRAVKGSILCRDILGVDTGNPDEMRKVVEQGLHISICYKAIGEAIEIAEEMF